MCVESINMASASAKGGVPLADRTGPPSLQVSPGRPFTRVAHCGVKIFMETLVGTMVECDGSVEELWQLFV